MLNAGATLSAAPASGPRRGRGELPHAEDALTAISPAATRVAMRTELNAPGSSEGNRRDSTVRDCSSAFDHATPSRVWRMAFSPRDPLAGRESASALSGRTWSVAPH